MLKIEGVWYRQCAYCLIWFPVEEIGWSDELLGWVCDEHPVTCRRARTSGALPGNRVGFCARMMRMTRGAYLRTAAFCLRTSCPT